MAAAELGEAAAGVSLAGPVGRVCDPSYRTIKGILVAGTETEPEPDTGDGGAAAFLHGPEGLFAAAIPTQTPDGHRGDREHGDAQEAAR